MLEEVKNKINISVTVTSKLRTMFTQGVLFNSANKFLLAQQISNVH